MPVVYTPEQRWLFDTDPTHWISDPGTDRYRHISQDRWLQIDEYVSSSTDPHGCMIFDPINIHDPSQGLVAMIDDLMHPHDVLLGLPGLLEVLSTTFSAEKRACMDEFVDHVAFLLIQKGRTGPHRAYLPDARNHRSQLFVVDPHDMNVCLDVPASLEALALLVQDTPSSITMEHNHGVLVASWDHTADIALPASWHAQMDFLAMLQESYPWARPLACPP